MKKLRIGLIIIFVLIIFLIVRIGFLQFVEGSELKELAYNQQAINQIISPKRGNIYDSTGKSIAISAQVDTITINPSKIVKENAEDTKAYKEMVAKKLSEIFSLDYEEVLNKVNSESNVETIVKKVEQDKVDELEAWMEENKITAVFELRKHIAWYTKNLKNSSEFRNSINKIENEEELIEKINEYFKTL